MPLYEYRCADCHATFDLLRAFSQADEPATCPECQSTHALRAPSRCAAFARGADGGTTAVAGGGCAGCAATSCATCHR